MSKFQAGRPSIPTTNTKDRVGRSDAKDTITAQNLATTTCPCERARQEELQCSGPMFFGKRRIVIGDEEHHHPWRQPKERVQGRHASVKNIPSSGEQPQNKPVKSKNTPTVYRAATEKASFFEDEGAHDCLKDSP